MLMFLGVFYLRLIWEMYSDFITVGKIILFPLILIFLMAAVIFGILETIVIDIWILLFALFSKSMSVKDITDEFWRGAV